MCTQKVFITNILNVSINNKFIMLGQFINVKNVLFLKKLYFCVFVNTGIKYNTKDIKNTL